MGVEYDELNTRYENLKSQLREKTLNANASLKSARNAVEVVLQKIPQDLKNYVANSTIRAPADGVVSFVDLKGPGQNISPGQTLVYLQGAGSELGVRLKVSDSDIGKVRRGMDVKLDIASYPSSEYGVQSATIREIPQKLDTSGKQSDSTFDVYGDLAAQHVLFKGQKYPLRSGVSLRAKIIVSHETLLKYYLKQLLSLKDEYLGDS